MSWPPSSLSVGDEEARSNHGLGYVDALDGPLSDGGSIPPASILELLMIPAVFLLGRGTVRFTVRSGGRIRLLLRLRGRVLASLATPGFSAFT